MSESTEDSDMELPERIDEAWEMLGRDGYAETSKPRLALKEANETLHAVGKLAAEYYLRARALERELAGLRERTNP